MKPKISGLKAEPPRWDEKYQALAIKVFVPSEFKLFTIAICRGN